MMPLSPLIMGAGGYTILVGQDCIRVKRKIVDESYKTSHLFRMKTGITQLWIKMEKMSHQFIEEHKAVCLL